MATPDRSPSLFEGQNWSEWAEKIFQKQGEDSTDGPPKNKTGSNIMKLRKDDMSLFGVCPSQDQCYLVVCERCGQILKPQALKVHIEQRHSSSNQPEKKSPASLSTHVLNIPKPLKSLPYSRYTSRSESPKPINKKSSVDLTQLGICKTQVPNSVSSERLSQLKSQQPVVNLEKIKVPSPLVRKTPTPPKVVESNVKPNGRVESPTVDPGGSVKKMQKQIPCKDREFDPDIHCGVFVSDTGQQCTRSLTCKRHLLSLRRAVSGRTKSFDQLLIEHRSAKERQKLIKLQQAAIQAAESIGKTPHFSRTSLNSSGHFSPLTLTSPRTNLASPSSEKAELVLMKPINRIIRSPFYRSKPSPLKEFTMQRLDNSLSSIAKDEPWTKMDGPVIPAHPRPASACTFNSRYCGGSLVFNRKLDSLRNAFSDCTERFLHPPPKKKQCVEPKPRKETVTGDPYAFKDTNGNISSNLDKTVKKSRPIKSKEIKRKKNNSGNGNTNANNNDNIPKHISRTTNQTSAVGVESNLAPLLINKNISGSDVNVVVAGIDPTLGPVLNLNTVHPDRLLQFPQNLILTSDGAKPMLSIQNNTLILDSSMYRAVPTQVSTTASQPIRTNSASPQVSSLPMTNGLKSSVKSLYGNHSRNNTPSPSPLNNDVSPNNSGQFIKLAAGGKSQKFVTHPQIATTGIINAGHLLPNSYQQLITNHPLIGQQIQIQGGSVKSDRTVSNMPSLSFPIVTNINQQPARAFYIQPEENDRIS